MKIEFTKKQYWDLMRAVYMADWMANAICDEGMKEDDEIKNVRDYIFSFAEEMGYEEYVKHDKRHHEYYATLEMDDEPSTRSLIERYDEHCTWDELGGWLGERDFFRKYNYADVAKMTDEDCFAKQMQCEAVWEQELVEYGIERLGIVEQ